MSLLYTDLTDIEITENKILLTFKHNYSTDTYAHIGDIYAYSTDNKFFTHPLRVIKLNKLTVTFQFIDKEYKCNNTSITDITNLIYKKQQGFNRVLNENYIKKINEEISW